MKNSIDEDDDDIDYEEIKERLDVAMSDKIGELKGETETMKKEFKKGKMELEDFIEDYKEAKKKLIKYEIMKSKMDQANSA